LHELGIASEIVNGAVEEACRQGARKITAVTVRIGVLRGVEPESLRLFHDHLSRGTIAEGSVLTIEEEPVRVLCDVCGELPGTGFSLTCPSCRREGVRLQGGDTLRFVSIEIDEQDPG